MSRHRVQAKSLGKLNVFISYSSRDTEVAQKIYNHLSSFDRIKPMLDRIDISPGDQIVEKVTKMIRSAAKLVVLISPSSIRSSWVAFELNAALYQHLTQRGRSNVIPVLVEPIAELPAEFHVIDDLEYVSFTAGDPEDIALQAIVSAILAEHAQPIKLHEDHAKARAAESRVPEQYVRLKSALADTIKNEMDPLLRLMRDIAQATSAQSHILSPEYVSLTEANALSEIWVVTTHLYNDLYDPTISKSVTENQRKGIKYIYFIEQTDLLRQRKKEYEERFHENQGQFEFIEVSGDIIMPFDEVVIYDANDDHVSWGYVQMTYGKYPILDKQSVFLKLPDRNLGSLTRRLMALRRTAMNVPKGRLDKVAKLRE
jgi:hypothetical protein